MSSGTEVFSCEKPFVIFVYHEEPTANEVSFGVGRRNLPGCESDALQTNTP